MAGCSWGQRSSAWFNHTQSGPFLYNSFGHVIKTHTYSIYESASEGSTWTCVFESLLRASGWVFFILGCQLRGVKHDLMSYEFTELWLSISFVSLSAYACASSYLSLFLWLFPSLLLSLVFLALFYWPVSWLDNANTLFITLHSFSGLYGMPSNQAIVSYDARELIMRHRTSVKAISWDVACIKISRGWAHFTLSQTDGALVMMHLKQVTML